MVHGWPQTWYAGRLLMPALVRDFRVIAVDKRGIGLSDKPHDGYDTGTLAGDLVALMDVLDHPRFAVVSGSPTRRLHTEHRLPATLPVTSHCVQGDGTPSGVQR